MKYNLHNTVKAMAIAVLTLTAAEMMAAPVVPAKEPATVTQPDGSTLHVRVVGDERHRIKLSDDGRRLISKQGVYYYADVDAEGRIVSTEVPAHNAATRSTEEAQFVATLSTDVMKVNSRRSRQAPKLNKGLLQASARVNGTTFPVKGKARTMVVLVDFSDNPFVTDDVYATFNEELNSPGFNQREHIGCAADYFRAQSFNKFDPQFDLYGPITVSKSVYYYGKDEDDDNIDVNISELVLEVCRALDPTVNFADYDLDGDGFVDNVYIFYAGYGENFSGAPDDVIWPHSATLQEWGVNAADAMFDGVRVDSYGCCAELYGTSGNNVAAIGTFCHEFSHILGLPDTYDANYDTDGYAEHPDEWDVMAAGCYLPYTVNMGAVPVGYNSLERMMLGWSAPITITQPQSITLEPLLTSGSSLRINTPDPNEYYLLENRQKTAGSYDYYLPYHGMLVWHVDMRPDAYINFNGESLSCADAWSIGATGNNAVNVDATHMCFDLIKATGNTGGKTSWNTPFPGAGDVTSFTDDTDPSMMSWAGLRCNAPITNIQEVSGNITFDFLGGGEGISVQASEATAIDSHSFTANWEPITGITDYSLNVWHTIYTKGDNTLTYDWLFTEHPAGWTMSGTYVYENGALTMSGTKASTITSSKVSLAAGTDINVTAKQYADENGSLTVWYGSSELGSMTPSTDFTTTTFSVPEGADSEGTIKVTSIKGQRVVLSEIQVYQPTIQIDYRTLDGYPVTVSNATAYTVDGLEADTDYSYQVSAVGFASSESDVINLTTATESGIRTIAPSTIAITSAAGGTIAVSGIGIDTTVAIYDLSGRCVYSSTIDRDTTIAHGLTHGLYIVRVGAYTTKVVL